MTMNQHYLAPEIMEHEIQTEGVLCESGADAGYFEEIEW